MIAHFQQLQVFGSSTIAQFYAEARWQYLQVQTYLQMLDYLWLLTLEYLQMQQAIAPVSSINPRSPHYESGDQT